MKRMLLVVNPQSGKSQIKNRLMETADVMIKAGYEIELYLTQGPSDAVRIVREKGEHADAVVCCGGDGTLHEVVNGVMALEPEKRPAVGYIPSGSTNDFAAGQGIPAQILKAARLIAGGRTSQVDLGVFNGEYFTYVAAFGVMTDVPYATPRESKAVLGYQAYLLEGVKRLTKIRGTHVRVTVDDSRFEGEVLLGLVSNAMQIAGIKGLSGKDARFDDGLFEVMLVEYSANPLELTEVAAEMINLGTPEKKVHHFSGKKITFSFDEPVDWVLDGEFGGSCTEAVIEVKQKILELFRQDSTDSSRKNL